MDREQLRALSREQLEDLTWQLVEIARSLADKTKQNSIDSSRPPSSDDPYRRRDQRQRARNDTTNSGDDAGGGAASPPSSGATDKKPAGKRPGMPGFWRRQPMVVTCDVDHDAAVCAACGAVLGAARRRRQDSAHYVYDLERSVMTLQIAATRHRYFVGRCACSHETIARPATGRCSEIEGRRRNLQLTERCLVGPMLASFPSVAGIVVHDHWRPYYTLKGVPHALCNPFFRAPARPPAWVPYRAARAPRRCTKKRSSLCRRRHNAHLIRKAVALAEGYYRPGSGFGREIAHDLRSLIEKVAAGDSDASIKRLLTRLKRNCQCNRYEVEDKVRALAREILNDWDAVIAFVDDPRLPPTNNDAERTLRHAVIARRIGYGTRTDEGRSCYAAALSVIETCRKRALDVAAYARDLIATARQDLPHPPIPLAQPP